MPRIEKELLPRDTGLDAVVDEVLALLSAERYRSARRLAAAALEKYPEHTRVERAWSIFDNRGKVRAVSRGPEPKSRQEELRWLNDPPESARGKWVALLGGEVAVRPTVGAIRRVLERCFRVGKCRGELTQEPSSWASLSDVRDDATHSGRNTGLDLHDSLLSSGPGAVSGIAGGSSAVRPSYRLDGPLATKFWQPRLVGPRNRPPGRGRRAWYGIAHRAQTVRKPRFP